MALSEAMRCNVEFKSISVHYPYTAVISSCALCRAFALRSNEVQCIGITTQKLRNGGQAAL